MYTQQQIRQLLTLLDQAFYVNGKRNIIVKNEGVDHYNVFHLTLVTERDEIHLGFPVERGFGESGNDVFSLGENT